MPIKIGICEWSLPLEGPSVIKLVSELGLEGIQIDIGQYELGFQLSYERVYQEYLYLAQEYNITITSLAVRDLDRFGMTRENGTREKEIAEKAILSAIKIAKSMGINHIMLPSFNDGEIKTSQDFKNVVECLKNTCDEAHKYGITVSTENLLSVSKNIDLFKKVNKDNLKLYFDTQNYYLNKRYNTADMFEKLSDKVIEIHAKDGKDDALSGAILGEGDSEFYKTIKSIRESEYTGWILLENYYNQEPLSKKSSNFKELVNKDVIRLKSL